MKWMFCPSISVVNCGKALILASCARQSNPSRQWPIRLLTRSTATPCSAPGISSVKRVSARRAWRSSSSDCGISTRKEVMVLMGSLRIVVDRNALF